MLTRLFFVLMLFTPLVSSNLMAASAISVEAYAKLPEKSLLAISPNGQRMAYRDTSKGRDLMVVLDVTKGALVKAVEIGDINPNQIYFVTDDVVILLATKNIRFIQYRGRYDSSWAYAFNLNNGEVNPLLSQGFGIHTGQTSLGRIAGISADGKYAYMPAIGDRFQVNLFKSNLHKKRKPKVHTRGTVDTVDFFMGDNDEVIARERYNNDNNIHRIEARIDGDWVEIFREEVEIPTKGFSGVTPDKQKLVFSEHNTQSDRWAYYTMDIRDGSISEPLFSRDDRDVASLLTDVNRRVYGVRYEGFSPTYEFFDEKLNKRLRGVNHVLPDNNLYVKDFTSDWSRIVFYMDGSMSAGDYLLYEKGDLSLLTSSRPDISPEAVHEVVEYRFKARDGLEIPTLLTVPHGKPMKALPAILLPHGGPRSYDDKGFDYLAQFFASQGYLVIKPQFRGSDGFGADFIAAGDGEWGRKMQDDLTDAVKALASDGTIDDSRVCIVGISYGGYAALAGATLTPDLYRCAVSVNGVSDVEKMISWARGKYGSDHWALSYWEKTISQGKFDDDHLAAISPVNHAEAVKAPVLLIHGELDQVVPLQQSERMQDALEDANKSVRFVELDRGDHSMSKASNRMQAMQAIAEFVTMHMGAE